MSSAATRRAHDRSHGDLGHGIHCRWGKARLAQCLPVPTQAQLGTLESGLDRTSFREDGDPHCAPDGLVRVPLEAAGPQAARLAPGLTDGCQGAAVPAVEVGPGFGLTALAAGQDPIAADAGQQAHPDGAAALVAELEEGNPARGPRSRRPVPAPYATDPAPDLPHISACRQRPEVLSRDVQHKPFRTENNHRAQMPPEGSDRAGQETVGPSRATVWGREDFCVLWEQQL